MQERVEIQTAVSTKNSEGWVISLELKNTGSVTSKMIRAFVNDVSINEANYGSSGMVADNISTDLQYLGTIIESGQTVTVHVWISKNYINLTSGTTINIKLHSEAGGDYIKLVELV